MEEFGHRKLNLQGGSYHMALPKKWVEKYNPNSIEVLVFQNDENNLVIAPATSSTAEAGADMKANTNISNLPEV